MSKSVITIDVVQTRVRKRSIWPMYTDMKELRRSSSCCGTGRYGTFPLRV